MKRLISSITLFILLASFMLCAVSCGKENEESAGNILDIPTVWNYEKLKLPDKLPDSYIEHPWYIEAYCEAPQEVLEAPTDELVWYVMKTRCVSEAMGILSSIDVKDDRREDNFKITTLKYNKAYRELLSRDDLFEALEECTKAQIRLGEKYLIDYENFEALIVQKEIVMLYIECPDASIRYPTLSFVYAEFKRTGRFVTVKYFYDDEK